jgi:hypothetical protein
MGISSPTPTGQAQGGSREESLASKSSAALAGPYVGLRPFASNESLLFFGRREQTIQLMERLHQTRFLAVIGSSGCGKSSLIRAGLIPKLKAGFLVEERDRWFIANMMPGSAPLDNFAAATLEALEKPADEASARQFVEAMRAGGAQGVSDWLFPMLEKRDANLLLLVDQFEEIFRFGLRSTNARNRDEAENFVSIILQLAQQRALPVYVVLTMRSDFIGDCDNFYGLPEAMNRSQYLVPRLTRQQRREAIEGPAMLFGGRVAPRLLDRVLNDVGDEPDQLPIMQHALMRAWEHWQKDRSDAMDLADYEAIGTIKEALSRDADRALEGASDEEMLIAKRMFQSLTDTDSRGRRVRRPVRLSEIEAITGASRDSVLKVIRRFQTGGRTFLNTTRDGAGGDPLIDISHESLIRQWKRLGDWVDEEARSRATYMRVVDAATRYRQRQAKLWGNPELEIALDWRERTRPNAQWAARYNPEFETAMDFLDKSKRSRRLRILFWAFMVALAVAVFAYDYRARHKAQVAEAQKDAVVAQQDKIREAQARQDAEILREREVLRMRGFLLGEPVTITHPIVGEIRIQQKEDGDVELLDGWREKNIVRLFIPEFGKTIDYYNQAVPQLKAALLEIARNGLIENVIAFEGPPEEEDGLSPYSLGIAFNIRTRLAQTNDERDTLKQIASIFAKHGFSWGGEKNPTYFQVSNIIASGQ